MPGGVPGRLSFAAEFAIVVVVAFGYFIVGSLVTLRGPESARITEADLQSLIVIEMSGMLMLGFLLHLRGWQLTDLGLVPTWEDVARGWKVVGITLLGYFALSLLLGSIAPVSEAASSQLVEPGIKPGVIAATSVINAVYEEVFVTGYVIAALRRRTSPWTPVLVSAGLRASYHLYQGVWGALIILLLGLAFAYWYARNGRLWPLIAAHAGLDLYALTLHTSA